MPENSARDAVQGFGLDNAAIEIAFFSGLELVGWIVRRRSMHDGPSPGFGPRGRLRMRPPMARWIGSNPRW